MEKSMETLMDDVRELKAIVQELKQKFSIIDEIVQFNHLCEKCRTIAKQIHKCSNCNTKLCPNCCRILHTKEDDRELFYCIDCG